MSDVISGRFVGAVVPDNRVKFGDPRLNSSGEIPPKAVWGGIVDGFFHCSFRPEGASDVISSATVGQVGVDVTVKFGDLAQTVHEIYSSEDVGFGIFARFFK